MLISKALSHLPEVRYYSWNKVGDFYKLWIMFEDNSALFSYEGNRLDQLIIKAI